jgi:hypothetical protein
MEWARGIGSKNPVTRAHYAKPHEVYMHVACSFGCFSECGQQLIELFQREVEKRGYKAIRMHASVQSKQF